MPVFKTKKGMILGKFLPPHKGHCYLIDFAKNFVDDLTIVVGTLKNEPIEGKLRFQWIKELYPELNVVHLTDENPQDPSEHPDFWNIWKNSLNNVLPYKPDYVFASEKYGHRLASELGAMFIPVNISRDIIPISATEIRNNPFKNWQYIPDIVKPYFVKKVCIFGPESTGKSTLSKNLAKHYQTSFVPEYARVYLEEKNGEVFYDDMEYIAQGQKSSEKALIKKANKIIFSDTDILTTYIWSEFLFNKCEKWIFEESKKLNYDLYLLTDVDVPWVKDIVRYLPNERISFMGKCEYELKKRNFPYKKISGSWDNRFESACLEVDKLLFI
jgi:HTH-type transcriptional repressor of NAD biosynthesis genes